MHKCFNPRPREGATDMFVKLVPIISVSIHAPVKGRPLTCPGTKPLAAVSIHAPVKGRHFSVLGHTTNIGFQSTPP